MKTPEHLKTIIDIFSQRKENSFGIMLNFLLFKNYEIKRIFASPNQCLAIVSNGDAKSTW